MPVVCGAGDECAGVSPGRGHTPCFRRHSAPAFIPNFQWSAGASPAQCVEWNKQFLIISRAGQARGPAGFREHRRKPNNNIVQMLGGKNLIFRAWPGGGA